MKKDYNELKFLSNLTFDNCKVLSELDPYLNLFFIGRFIDLINNSDKVEMIHNENDCFDVFIDKNKVKTFDIFPLDSFHVESLIDFLKDYYDISKQLDKYIIYK